MRFQRPRFRTAALLAAGAALVGTALLQSPATAGTPAADSARASAPMAAAAVGPTIWEDNFDGPSGQAPDSSKWRYDIGGSGWGNDERQYYTNSTRNAAMDGAGNLVITARRESGGLPVPLRHLPVHVRPAAHRRQTFTQTYGRFEARIKIPQRPGHLAGLLDARRRQLAQRRRDRHHGEHRP